MKKTIRVFTHNKDGHGVEGRLVRVSTNINVSMRTNREGKANLTIDTSGSIEILIDDEQRFIGTGAEAPNLLTLLV